jgi:hypothetical protein
LSDLCTKGRRWLNGKCKGPPLRVCECEEMAERGNIEVEDPIITEGADRSESRVQARFVKVVGVVSPIAGASCADCAVLRNKTTICFFFSLTFFFFLLMFPSYR